MKYYWIGWYQPTEDHRPLRFPPQRLVFGWWCTGQDMEDNFTMVAWVKARNEEEAKETILTEWPEAERWRFCERKERIESSDRFPFSDWMKKRIDAEDMSPQLYYIQEKDRTVGNSATWWRKNDQGYSCHLEEAGKYCEEEMIKRTKDVEDVGWPVEDIDEMATRQVDVQKMYRHLEFINKKLGIENKEA